MTAALTQPVRLDKWLWAARFFKTRSIAAEAVNGGKVHLNGNRVKPARNVAVGDQLVITIGTEQMQITVLALSGQRRPANETRLWYLESEESLRAREENREMRRLAKTGYAPPEGKPGKRDRRKIRTFTRKD
jgi:ribosome-associated heat shock protein Hsp15